MFESLHDQFPNENPVHLDALAEVWSIELSKIIDRMLEISKDREAMCLPTQARPEAIFELSKLVLWLERQIVKTKTARTPIRAIDGEAERDALTSPPIQDRIENTAAILAEHVWLRLYDEWWKRFPMIQQESPKSVKHILLRRTHDGRKRHHFSPKFSNKHWASETGQLRVYELDIDGTVRSKDVPVKSWGRESFLYSQGLEYHLSLVEGDTGATYKKLLQMIPLNEDETRRWVAFLAVQLIRAPGFILGLLPKMDRFVTEQGLDFPTDTGSLRRAYETLFSNDRVFAEMYLRLVSLRWEMWSATPSPGFVRPDEPVLITSAVSGNWQLLYPMTPTHCFVAGPAGADTSRHVVPHVRAINEQELSQLNLLLAASSRRTVIASPQANDLNLRASLASGMRHRHRSSQTRGSSSHEFWGDIDS